MKEHQKKILNFSTKEFVCSKHGPYFAKPVVMLGKIRKFNPPCPKCTMVFNQEKQDYDEKDRENTFLDEVKKANIPPKFCKLNFRDFDSTVSDGADLAIRTVQAYYNKFYSIKKRGTSLILSGFPGTGKTHLACTVLNRLLYEKKNVYYTTATGMIDDINDTQNHHSKFTKKQVLYRYKKYELLVIDEIGIHENSKKELVLFFDIIDGRYLNNLPTILISNLIEDEFKNYIGERAFDRLKESNGVTLAFTWESYRK